MNEPVGNSVYAQVAESLYPGSKLLNHYPLLGGVSAIITCLEIELVNGELKQVIHANN